MTSATPIHVLQLCHLSGQDTGRIASIVEQCQRLEMDHAAEVRSSILCVRPRGLSGAAFASQAADKGVDFDEISHFGRADITALWRVARRIRRRRVEVVHAHDAKSHLLAILLQPLGGFRLVATAAEAETVDCPSRLAREIDCKLLPGFDRIIAANHQLAWQLCQLGCRPSQVDVIHAAVDTQRFCREHVQGNLRRRMRVRRRDHVIGADARGLNLEGVEAVLRASRIAESELGPITVMLLCHPGAETTVRQSATTHGIANRVRTWVPDDTLPRWHASIDVFLAVGSSPHETRTLLDAQSMEVPVVCTRDSGLSVTIVDSGTATLVESNVESMAEGLVQVLSHRTRSRAMAASARLRVCQRYGSLDPTRQLASSYRRAIEFV